LATVELFCQISIALPLKIRVCSARTSPPCRSHAVTVLIIRSIQKIANGSKVTAALSRIHVPGRAPCSARQIPLKALINDNQMHSIVRPCSATGSGKPPGERQGGEGQGRVFSAGGKPGCRNWRITPPGPMASGGVPCEGLYQTTSARATARGLNCRYGGC